MIMATMRDVTIGVLRQRYLLGRPHALDLTNVDNVPTMLRDLGETWRRTMIQRRYDNGPGSPGAVAIGCAEYVEALADMIDAALLAEAQADAEHYYSSATCVACGDLEPCRPDEAGDPVCEACRPTWEGE